MERGPPVDIYPTEGMAEKDIYPLEYLAYLISCRH
jgi:hypothetical protein